MTRCTLAVAAAAIALWTPVVQAHHSIYGVYDSTRQATLDGIIAEFQLINPHPFLFIEVADSTGAAQRWRLEVDNRSELTAIGVTANTFKRGERVVVRGSLARSQPQSLYLLRLDRSSDGFWYEQVGASPRIGPATQDNPRPVRPRP
jgi:Family of unknown function (DUF6152)